MRNHIASSLDYVKVRNQKAVRRNEEPARLANRVVLVVVNPQCCEGFEIVLKRLLPKLSLTVSPEGIDYERRHDRKYEGNRDLLRILADDTGWPFRKPIFDRGKIENRNFHILPRKKARLPIDRD